MLEAAKFSSKEAFFPERAGFLFEEEKERG